ncbi:putative zinc-binding dehydrogenase [Colletotrichum incanum]|nr:putative zinc-binding dehydrogenase [Colletotrichum incanum]
MSLNQAVKIVAAGTAQVVDAPIPQFPADDYNLVKIIAVAVNPTDWKHIENVEYFGCIGCRVGCDYAGVVEEVGLSEAATLGVAMTTVGQALYQTLNLPLPTATAEMGKHIFINGGSTAMRIFGIQYAKMSGFTVSATSSPHNFNYLKSLVSDAVFDYKSPTVSADDCQSAEESVILVDNAFSTEGGIVSTLLPVSEEVLQRTNPKARMEMSLYYSVFGEPFSFLALYDAVPENYEFGGRFQEISRNLLEQENLRPIRSIKNHGGSGLEDVLVGLEELKKGRVTAGKLVYTL